jgi:adenylosuccinate synthase
MNLEKLGHTCVIGLQWGDEGKGKVVELLTDRFSLGVRYSGGSNAGHTVKVAGERFALHLIPSAILHPRVTCVIAAGVVVDPEVLVTEIENLRTRGVKVEDNLRVSNRAHVVMPYHRRQDELSEANASGDRRIGTTARGIGPCYADKMTRTSAIRIGDLIEPQRFRRRLDPIVREKNAVFAALYGTNDPFDADEIFQRYSQYARKIQPHVCDTTQLLHEALADGRHILFEGAQGSLLDIDHGTFPYVTSSNSSGCGAAVGAGVPASVIQTRIGVVKAYFTRVGGGPFPTEQEGPIGEYIREHGQEYGTTTGRPRRCGWFDAAAARYSVHLGGITDVAVMHLDTLTGLEQIGICVGYRHDGRQLAGFDPDEEVLASVECVYEMMPGWSQDITSARREADLPTAAREYIDRLEQLIGAHISIVSVGPERDQTIFR